MQHAYFLRNVIFLLYQGGEHFFSSQIPLIYKHLFYKYFIISVCRLSYKRQKQEHMETWVSQSLIKIDDWFFCALSSHIWSSILLIFCMSAYYSVNKGLKCKNMEMWFSRPLIKIHNLFFFMWTFHSYINIYSIFLYVILSDAKKVEI